MRWKHIMHTVLITQRQVNGNATHSEIGGAGTPMWGGQQLYNKGSACIKDTNIYVIGQYIMIISANWCIGQAL